MCAFPFGIVFALDVSIIVVFEHAQPSPIDANSVICVSSLILPASLEAFKPCSLARGKREHMIALSCQPVVDSHESKASHASLVKFFPCIVRIMLKALNCSLR